MSSTVTATQHWTVAEWERRFPEYDGKRYELLDGELFVSAAPAYDHQRIIGRLNHWLSSHVEQFALGEITPGPIDLVVDDRTVLEPDLIFLAAGRPRPGKRFERVPPDLVVEVISPGGARRDRVLKKAAYARLGVPHYWIVDPEHRTLEVYELRGGIYSEHARWEGNAEAHPAPFPEWTLDLGALWQA